MYSSAEMDGWMDGYTVRLTVTQHRCTLYLTKALTGSFLFVVLICFCTNDNNADKILPIFDCGLKALLIQSLH